MSGKKLPFGARFGLAVLSFVLGILLFASAVVTMLIADVRIITSENNIRQLTKMLLGSPQRVHSVVSVYRGAVGVPSAAGPRMEEESAGASGQITDMLIDFMFQGLKDQMGDQMSMTQEELEALVEQSTVKEFITDKAASLVTDYVTGEVTTTISGEEIKELIEENQDLIEQVVGKPLPSEVVNQIAQVVETNEVVQKIQQEGLAGIIEDMENVLPENGGAAGGVLGGLRPKDPNSLGKEIFGDKMGDTIANISSTLTGGKLEGLGSISDVLTLLRSVTSVGKLIAGIAICLVLMAAIIFANIKQLGKGLRRSGYPLMWAGSAFAMNLVVLFVPSLFDPNVLVFLPPAVGAILQPVRHVLLMTTAVNGVAFGLGLGLVIAGFVVGSIAKKNGKKAENQPVFAPVGAPVEMIVEAPVEVSEEAAVEVSEEAPEEVAEVCEAAEEAKTEEE